MIYSFDSDTPGAAERRSAFSARRSSTMDLRRGQVDDGADRSFDTVKRSAGRVVERCSRENSVPA